MALIKLEENIREKLQERELQPSAAAWDKLEAQLDNSHPKGKNKLLWFAIAASITALLIVGSLVFTAKSSDADKLVQEDISPESSDLKSDPMPELQVIKEEPIASEKRLQKTEKPKDEKFQLAINEAQVDRPSNKTKPEESSTPSQFENSRVVEPIVISIEDAKVAEVASKIRTLQENGTTITNEEVEALLDAAQAEVRTERILLNQTGKVDANALLMDVEDELERSFRDKVFDALGQGYTKLRTAFNERNN